MDIKRCYELLEVETDSSLSEIKQSYRDLVQIWHPDRFPSDNYRVKQKAEEKLKEINEAYRIITYNLQKKQDFKSEDDDRLNDDSDNLNECYLDVCIGGNRWTVTPSYITYGNTSIKTNEVSKIRWGGILEKRAESILNPINLFYLKKKPRYIFIIGTFYKTLRIECTHFINGFDFVVDELWKAVGLRLYKESVLKLLQGKDLSYGKILVNKDGILYKNHMFEWENIEIQNGNGCLILRSIPPKLFSPNLNQVLPHLDIDNINILEAVVRFLLKDNNYKRLRDGNLRI